MTRKKRRLLHRLRALFKRKFWTKCARCGHAFGGHEPHGTSLKFDAPGNQVESYRIVCQHCAKEALTKK